MQLQTTVDVDDFDEPLIDGSYIDKDLGIKSRSRRNYRAKGILPPPDTNLLGRDLWRVSTYRKFKADLLAGRFAMLRRPPHLRDNPIAR
jgi:hypothetical protein